MSSEQPDNRAAGQRGVFGTPSGPGADPRAPWLPAVPRPVGQPISPVDWFRRMPGGGTVFVRPVQDEATAADTEQE